MQDYIRIKYNIYRNQSQTFNLRKLVNVYDYL